jgi:hypothetical protein
MATKEGASGGRMIKDDSGLFQIQRLVKREISLSLSQVVE